MQELKEMNEKDVTPCVPFTNVEEVMNSPLIVLMLLIQKLLTIILPEGFKRSGLLLTLIPFDHLKPSNETLSQIN